MMLLDNPCGACIIARGSGERQLRSASGATHNSQTGRSPLIFREAESQKARSGGQHCRSHGMTLVGERANRISRDESVEMIIQLFLCQVWTVKNDREETCSNVLVSVADSCNRLSNVMMRLKGAKPPLKCIQIFAAFRQDTSSMNLMKVS